MIEQLNWVSANHRSQGAVPYGDEMIMMVVCSSKNIPKGTLSRIKFLPSSGIPKLKILCTVN